MTRYQRERELRLARAREMHQARRPKCPTCRDVGRILVRGPRRARQCRSASIVICPDCQRLEEAS